MLETEVLEGLWKAFKDLGQDGITMNHYELALACAKTCPDPQIWKEFLMEQTVSDYINCELNILRSTELSKLIKDVSKSKSVGQAQLVNALMKMKEEQRVKTGPAFVYCYIPLSVEQQECKNIVKLDKDPFLKRSDSDEKKG